MKKEDIDALFEFCKEWDTIGIIELVTDEKLKKKALQSVTERYQMLSEFKQESPQIIKRIVEQIKNSDVYQYFEEKGLEKHKRDFLDLITIDKISVEKANEYVKNFSAGYDKLKIILATQDEEYIKQCIKDDSLELDSHNKLELIKTIGDIEFLKQCAKDDSLNLYDHDKIKLICEITAIESSEKDSLANIEVNDFIDECSREYSIDLSDIIDKFCLIESINDIGFLQKCIKDKSLGFNETLNAKLIEKTKNVQPKENEEFDYTDYVKKCIEDENLMLTDYDKAKLVISTEDTDVIKTFVEQGAGEKRKQIDLPKGMTIGIEIEAEGMELEQTLFDGWVSKKDGSLTNGLEVISPILRGNDEDVQNIYGICNLLEKLKCETSENCGGHIHIGANYLTSKEAYINLLELWGNCEKIMYIISNAPGDITRESGITTMAQPTSKVYEKALEEGKISLQDEGELQAFVNELQNIQGDRHVGLNFESIKKHSTIEFRLSNGTINPDIWIENINLFGGIIKVSEQLAQIQIKDEQDRSPEEQRLLKLFECIKDKETGEKEKLDALLSLAVDEDKKDIYIDRYEINSQLLQDEHPDLENEITTRIATKPLDVKKDIAKKVLTGPDAIMGNDIEQAATRLENDMRIQPNLEQENHNRED